MNRQQAGPPRAALWLAGLRMPMGTREFQIGDLIEEYHDRDQVDGASAAYRWLWRQAWRNLVHPRPRSADPPRPAFSSGNLMSRLWNNVLLSLRMIRRAPAASAAAILTYALGIGANVAIFSVAWPVLVAPLPFEDESRIVSIHLVFDPAGRRTPNPISAGDYFDLRQASSFASIASYNTFATQWNLTGHGDAAQVRVGIVNDEFFSVLGVRPIVGRPLQKGDADSGANVVVLNERLWRTSFAADRQIVGRAFGLNGVQYTVVGVLPRDAALGLRDADVWVPRPEPTSRVRQAYFLGAVARLKPGVTLDVANQELVAIMQRAAAEFPKSNKHVSAQAQPLRDRITGPVRPTYLLLVTAAAFVLLIAATNLAALQLARGLHRDGEMRMRLALGASRAEIVRQLLTENVALAVFGGAAGLACASAALPLLAQLSPALARVSEPLAAQPSVLLYTVLLSLVAGLGVGLVPAWRLANRQGPLAVAARGTTMGRAASRARSAIVGVQVALTVMLLIVATFVTVSLWRVLAIDPGFDLGAGVVADVTLPASGYPTLDARRAFFDALVSRVEAIPGVERACASNDVPLDNAAFNMTYVAEGTTTLVSSYPKTVTSGCFDVLRIRATRGRLFDDVEREPVAIVSESMAQQLWPDGSDPIGRRIHLGLPSGDQLTVVGVVPDIRNASLESRREQQVWTPHAFAAFSAERLLVRSAVPPTALAAELRRVVRELDANLALANVRTMDDVVVKATSSRRFMLALLMTFGGIALGLSAVGIYGVLSHLAGRRTHEIGIRMALGARASDVMRLIGAPMAVAILAGAAVGAGAARSGSRLFESMLFRSVSATDARVYVGVVAFVVLVAFLAAWVPTRRAARLNPVRALRTA